MTQLLFEASHDTPLVWISVLSPTGAAAEQGGYEGITRLSYELARRGTKHRSRLELDTELDSLGASFDPAVGRDWAGFSGLCLSDDVERLVEIAVEVMSTPSFLESEFSKLMTETGYLLDDLRDDDSTLALRFFLRECAPGHPYGRTALGTQESLARIDRSAILKNWSASADQRPLVAIAGDLSAERAKRFAELFGRGASAEPAAPLVWEGNPGPQRTVLVDKPERKQSQVVLGLVGPRYGSDQHIALSLAEIAFGGVFSSRLTQEIRVKNGWSYGAGCHLARGRLPHFFRVSLAPAQDVAAQATEKAISMLHDLARDGLSQAELDFAKDNALGSMPFERATARRRLQIAIENEMYGLPEDFETRSEERIRGIGLHEVNDALHQCLADRGIVTSVLCTADNVRSDFEARVGPCEVVAYDSY